MKTITSTKTFKSLGSITLQLHVIILAASIAGAVATQSALAAPGYFLDLTENSSTSLSLAYTGPGGASSFSVANTSPDRWSIQVLSQTITINNFEYDFVEPEDPINTVNEVSHNLIEGNAAIYVKSDLPIELDHGGYIGIDDLIGNDGGISIILRFNDLAAVTEAAQAPDGGSTLGLLALAATALFSVSRLRVLRFP